MSDGSSKYMQNIRYRNEKKEAFEYLHLEISSRNRRFYTNLEGHYEEFN